MFLSPGIPSWSKPLPNPLHIGRKVRLKNGKVGIVTSHYINGDDCSGNYGQHLYALDGETPNNSLNQLVEEAVFLD